MKKNYLLTLSAFVAGVVFGVSGLTLAAQQDSPAYLVVSGSYQDRDGMSDYYAAAQPLAAGAGIEILARSDTVDESQVLEGRWPGQGFVIVERFTSMQALHDFWYSEEYQAAAQLRADKVTMDFIIAVPGVD